MKRKDMTGERVGRLVALRVVENDSKGRTQWLCLCDCGNTTTVTTINLRPTHTTSCGCFKSEVIAAGANTRHGKKHSKAYNAWCAMKDRCYNPNYEFYDNYGGRGISVCDRWKNSFENFYQDMGDPPPNLSLDRYPDNDGNYEPSNCRWATPKEQANNRRPRRRKP